MHESLGSIPSSTKIVIKKIKENRAGLTEEMQFEQNLEDPKSGRGSQWAGAEYIGGDS
jgi:hypothetical protein